VDYVIAFDDVEWSSADAPGLSAEFAFTPDVIQEDYTSAYRAKFARISAGGRSDTHVDPHNHAFYIISGTGGVQIEDRRWEMRPGSIVKVPRGLPHSLENTGTDDLVFLAIFDPPRQAADATATIEAFGS
jgi:quercetin dioxygenase-like cupin family protein